MKVILFVLLLVAVSCRSSKTVETTRTEIDSTYWYATVKRMTLADIQKMVDVQITVTELTPDSSDTMKPTKQTRYDIEGVTTTSAEELVVEEDSIESVRKNNEEQKESMNERPKKPPSIWLVGLSVLFVIIVIRKLL